LLLQVVEEDGEMSRLLVISIVASTMLSLSSCSRPPLPANASPPKDRAELEARYERLEPGMPEEEIAAFMGKAGAEIAGYSSSVVKRKPETGGEAGAGRTAKNWASDDATSAIRVVLDSNGKARQIQLLRMTPMGPVPRQTGEPNDP
jgi:hypothetical protein